MNWKPLIPKEEISKRIRALQTRMQIANLEAALIAQRVDLLYFTGTAQNAYLFIPAEGNPILMVKKYYPRARQESGIEIILRLDSVKQIPDTIKATYGNLPHTLGLELDVLPYREASFYQSMFRDCHIEDLSPLIIEQRRIKSQWEIDQLKMAASSSAQCFEFALGLLTREMTPIQLASTIQKHARKLGHAAKLRLRHHYEKALPFNVRVWPLTRLTPPQIGTDCILQVDIRWMFNGYHLDETRLFAIGKPPSDVVQVSQALLEMHNYIIDQARPSRPAASLYGDVKKMANSLGYGDSMVGLDFMDRPSLAGPLGHGIGLELFEAPWINGMDKTVLMPGMILTVKPAILARPGLILHMASVIKITGDRSELISNVPAMIFEKS